jgi:hypothetical protein
MALRAKSERGAQIRRFEPKPGIRTRTDDNTSLSRLPIMILAAHQLVRHFPCIEQIMNSLLGIFIKTFVASNARIGNAKCDHYPTALAHPSGLDCSQRETREPRRRRYFAIVPGQQMVVCMGTEFRS